MWVRGCSQPTPNYYLECLCLMLLCEWMHRCVSAVDLVFSRPQALPHIVALVCSSAE